MKKIVISAVSLFFTSFSFAQTQYEINEDAHKEFLKVDKQLNTVYQTILKEYKEDTAFTRNLKASQKIWIQFRDAEIKMKYPDREPGYYGSAQPMCYSIYLSELTRQRIDTLKQWLDRKDIDDVCTGSVQEKQ